MLTSSNPANQHQSAMLQAAYDAIFIEFRELYPEVSESLLHDFKKATSLIQFKKNETILDYGEICRKCLFVLEGMVCSYLIFDGIEKPVWYIGGGEITIGVESFYDQKPSKEKLTALEDTTCLSLDWQLPAFV